MRVLSHVEVGKKDSKQREQLDNNSEVRVRLTCTGKLKTRDYCGIKCETGNGTSEAENVSKEQYKKVF